MLPAVVVLQLVALFVLFAASALFSMSETAFIGVSRHTVRQKAEEGDHKARLVDSMLDDPQRFLSTVLVGNTVVNISSATLATVIMAQLLSSWATLVATVSVTVIVLIFCELVPKSLAVQHPLPIARAMARPLRLTETILKPFIGMANGASKLVLRLFGERAVGKAPYITSDEIEMLVRMGVEGGEVRHFEQRVISDVFEFTETDVHKVMTPAARVHSLPKDATLAQAMKVAAKRAHSRIVIVDGSFDRVLGAVHIKDLLHYKDEDLERLPVTLALRGCLFAPHDLPADRLLVRMQKEHKALAVIQDGKGKNIGIVTASDLLEELVGELHDEFDAARPHHDAAHVAAQGGGTAGTELHHGHTHTKGAEQPQQKAAP